MIVLGMLQEVFQRFRFRYLSKIPIIGPVLFNQTVIVYLMYAIVILIQVALYKSSWGLRTRAVGELPIAADSVGIDVNKLRFRKCNVGWFGCRYRWCGIYNWRSWNFLSVHDCWSWIHCPCLLSFW